MGCPIIISENYSLPDRHLFRNFTPIILNFGRLVDTPRDITYAECHYL